ncbi:MAG: S46 family peptidase [Candidatus Aminicenantes bacterium]|nr:S46 family peptidase [Candidatus Aminicenantes bacterium]
MNTLRGKFWIGILALVLAGSAFADEGLWLFNMPPTQILKSKYNFQVTPEWLEHVRLSSVRFGGASGSFVSPDGLVLTNHHVGQGAIQQLSTQDKDLMKTGFYARTRAEELKVPGMELSVLQSLEDVTARVKGAERPDMTTIEAAEARDKEIAAIEKEEGEKTGLRCSVVDLFSGGMYHVYRYKVFTDVRLVFAPEYLIAFFGGDQDNFTYPRYDLDISLFRLYENDKPYASPHYLKWSTDRLKEGDLILVSGHPGSTGRLLTYAQLEFLRDVGYPWQLANYERRRTALKYFSRRGAEAARNAQGTLFGIENSLKAVTGYQSGLLDRALMEKKLKEETALREAVRQDPEMEKLYGKAWDEIAQAQKAFASIYKTYRFFEGGAGFSTTHFSTARNLVRLAVEKGKPDAERLREYRDVALPALTRRLTTAKPIFDELEVFNLTDSLIQLQKEFGSMTEVKWLFAGRLAEDVAKELVAGTKLGNPEVRKSYLDRGLQAVYLSDDPMIKLAWLIDPVSRGIRKQYEQEVESVETRNGALIAQALFRIKGTTIPPDATGSLRLSFGAVNGYVENGKKIPYFTTFKGLYDLAAKNGYKDPYELPASFLSRKAKVNLDTAVNFVATCDSIGGNSGSPAINRKGEFAGVLFDGNIQSLPSRFVYTDTLNRSVLVHAKGIIEALTNVYDAKPLAEEILGKK